jgi:ribosomal protein S18 acetylase RimI-like enzyme
MEDATAGRPGNRPPGLGPHCVGQRVVVRRLVRGEQGPTGGPAFTDVLGTMLAWDERTTVVEREDGSRVTIELADVVSGKPVPPRPSVRHRVTPAEAERRAMRGWPAVEVAGLGNWTLRASGGFSARANSALVLDSPGCPVDEGLAEVRAFYAARGLPPLAQVVVGSAEEEALLGHGWRDARPGEAETLFQVGSVAQVSRALRPLPLAPGPDPVTITDHTTDAWLADDARARQHPDAAVAVLEGPTEVAFVSLGDPVVAKGRVSHVDDWAGITDVWVSPEHRRQGLALVVVRELVGWAAERGATTAYLQVRGDNPAALALYERLGFTTHHAYRYLVAPGTGPQVDQST